MSGIKKLTPGEIKLIMRLYTEGQTNIRLLTLEVNKRRSKNNGEMIRSINTVKNYLVNANIYVNKRSVPASQINLPKIVVDVNVKTTIKNELKLGSYPSIRKALGGNASTPQLIRIREAAKELGGVEIEIKIKPIKIV